MGRLQCHLHSTAKELDREGEKLFLSKKRGVEIGVRGLVAIRHGYGNGIGERGTRAPAPKLMRMTMIFSGRSKTMPESRYGVIRCYTVCLEGSRIGCMRVGGTDGSSQGEAHCTDDAPVERFPILVLTS